MLCDAIGIWYTVRKKNRDKKLIYIKSKNFLLVWENKNNRLTHNERVEKNKWISSENNWKK